MEGSNDLLSTSEAAALLGISRTTLNRYAQAGSVRSIVLPTGVHRFRRSEIEKLLCDRADRADLAAWVEQIIERAPELTDTQLRRIADMLGSAA